MSWYISPFFVGWLVVGSLTSLFPMGAGLLTGEPTPALEILWQILVKIALGDDGLTALLVWCRDGHGCGVNNLSDSFYDGTSRTVPRLLLVFIGLLLQARRC